jgi:anion-transporting  ArsA/GET3 family ATPase
MGDMASALERKLVVVAGKGGVGKTTVSAAVGVLAARRGLRTIVVEVSGANAQNGTNGTGRLPALLGLPVPPPHGVEAELADGLWCLSIDPDRVLAEWLRALGGQVSSRVLTSSSAFQYLIAAAPGAREMLSMVKVWELAEGRRSAERAADYDLVVLDAPATGHALAMLGSPRTFSAIARVGPIARQSQQVRDLLEDPARSAYLAVAQATEMAVTETLQLSAGLRRELSRELHAVVVNGTLPRRFDSSELRQIADLSDGADNAETRGASLTRSAARAARGVHGRVRAQQRQIARLRRGTGTHGSPPVSTVPFIFRSELELEAVRQIADRLARTL